MVKFNIKRCSTAKLYFFLNIGYINYQIAFRLEYDLIASTILSSVL